MSGSRIFNNRRYGARHRSSRPTARCSARQSAPVFPADSPHVSAACSHTRGLLTRGGTGLGAARSVSCPGLSFSSPHRALSLQGCCGCQRDASTRGLPWACGAQQGSCHPFPVYEDSAQSRAHVTAWGHCRRSLPFLRARLHDNFRECIKMGEDFARPVRSRFAGSHEPRCHV